MKYTLIFLLCILASCAYEKEIHIQNMQDKIDYNEFTETKYASVDYE